MATSISNNNNWSSRLTFLLASIGFSVGLGNIWRFPYITGENGGGAFVLIYLACALCIGVPLVMSEWAIGRQTKQAASAATSFKLLATDNNLSPQWSKVGAMAILAVFMMMLTYTVITGWTLDYFTMAIAGEFVGINSQESKQHFESLMASPVRLIFWHTLVVIIIIMVNIRGVQAGIEKAVTVLMPALFICLIAMVCYAAMVGDMSATVDFLLKPDFSQVSGQTFLLALGQAFFSVGIAMAVMVTYGSYLDPKTSIASNAIIVVVADTLVAMLAGFAIFPLVFSNGLTPDTGTGLVFQVLPIALSDLPGGQIFSGIFFLLLIAAAFTSCIGNFEPIIAWTSDRFKLGRAKATLLSGLTIWLLGIGSVLSLNQLSGYHPLALLPFLENKTIFESLDYISASILLPLGGLLTAIFVGWRLPPATMQAALGLNKSSFRVWQLLIRYLIPVAITLVFLSGFSL
ncbi:sodium-dependent transporter [Shewanella violacea]|uniref:Transporter n=1 Tax=Shewanella violacea (strain JCM 10179 / CIP 106290 / LMG 19151 / DSS12) TaxID=637905 RepID=D4ZFC8_SHEVD|nr:sodium-dependent transporter [Shewanella violacea]BAJ04292.1 sodium-dependent transporter, putative [Shewanella violacea DSS12]